MACPHVAGLIAYIIGRIGNMTPAEMSAKLKSMSVKNALTDIRKYAVYSFRIA